MPNTDCFAYVGIRDREKPCIALTKLLCAKKCDCPFFKTIEQITKEDVQTRERLARMGLQCLYKGSLFTKS